jgi:hypothetical protein
MAAQWDLARAWLIQASVVDPALCHCFRGFATQKAARASLKPKNWRQSISRKAGGMFQTASTGARDKAPIAREERRVPRLPCTC